MDSQVKELSAGASRPRLKFYVVSKGDEHKGYMDGCVLWWRAGGHGYTNDLNCAGIFTEEDMEAGYPPPQTCHYIRCETVESHTYSPRLAYWSRGKNALCNFLEPAAGTAVTDAAAKDTLEDYEHA